MLCVADAGVRVVLLSSSFRTAAASIDSEISDNSSLADAVAAVPLFFSDSRSLVGDGDADE